VPDASEQCQDHSRRWQQTEACHGTGADVPTECGTGTQSVTQAREAKDERIPFFSPFFSTSLLFAARELRHTELGHPKLYTELGRPKLYTDSELGRPKLHDGMTT